MNYGGGFGPSGPTGYPGRDVFGAPGAQPPPPGFPGRPPAPAQEVNELATLSVIVAFVFAPAGAVLGHLALSRIKRTGEPGRRRAIIGTTLSYLMTVLAVIALAAWQLWPTPPSPDAQIPAVTPAQALLTIPELDRVMHATFRASSYAPDSAGGPELLNSFTNVFEGEDYLRCAGAVYPVAQSTYQGGTVDAVAARSVAAGDGEHRYTGVDQSAVQLTSPAQAQRILEQATKQWQECEGTTLHWKIPNHSRISMAATISNVRLADGMLTATLQRGSRDSSVYSPSARVLAVKDNFVIETDVSMYDLADTNDSIGVTGPDAPGMQVARAILDKIGRPAP